MELDDIIDRYSKYFSQVPTGNLDLLSQNEFNTLYNKTVQQIILRNYYSNNLCSEPGQIQETVGAQQQKTIGRSQQPVQGHFCDFSPYLKQPPVYNPPPPPALSPLKSGQNGCVQNHCPTAKCNLISSGQPNLLQIETSGRGTSGPLATNGAAKTNLQVVGQHPVGTSPPLTAASQQLVMSLNDEFRASRVMRVQREAADASQQEVLAALQATGWDTNQAAKQIIRDRQAKVESLVR